MTGKNNMSKNDIMTLKGLIRTAILDNDARAEYEKKQAEYFIKKLNKLM